MDGGKQIKLYYVPAALEEPSTETVRSWRFVKGHCRLDFVDGERKLLHIEIELLEPESLPIELGRGGVPGTELTAKMLVRQSEHGMEGRDSTIRRLKNVDGVSLVPCVRLSVEKLHVGLTRFKPSDTASLFELDFE